MHSPDKGGCHLKRGCFCWGGGGKFKQHTIWRDPCPKIFFDQLSRAKNIAELLLLQYEVLHLSCLGPLYVMDTYQEYEDQHK
jgi:hypothetical protein